MTEQTTAESSRLAMIRRLYLYLIAFISLVAGLAAAYDLIDALVRLWVTDERILGVYASDSVQRSIARPGGFLIVSAPIFLIHWRYIRRLVLQPGESHAALRKLFVYAVLATTGFVGARALYHIIEGSLGLLLGATPIRRATETWWLGRPVLPRRHSSDPFHVLRAPAPGRRRPGRRVGLGRQLAAPLPTACRPRGAWPAAHRRRRRPQPRLARHT